MKRFLFIFTALLLCLSASAQSECKSDSDSVAVKKWYIEVNGGVQIFSGMTDKYLPFGESVAPVGGLRFGRYLNNWLNVDFNATAAQFKGVYTRPVEKKHFATGECFDLNTQKYYQKGTYLQLYARIGVDINTILAGYKEDRTLSFVPYIGGGIATGLGKNVADVSNFAIVPTLDYGIDLNIRISSSCTGLIDIHGNAVGRKLDNEGCTVHSFHASYGAKVGLRFYLGK